VESIFGNSGDPFIPDNDAAIDPVHWTGTTGCIILATHLTELTKRNLDFLIGTRLPNASAAMVCVGANPLNNTTTESLLSSARVTNLE